VGDWTVEEVLTWLEEEVGLPEYRGIFSQGKIDGATLLNLKGEDLEVRGFFVVVVIFIFLVLGEAKEVPGER